MSNQILYLTPGRIEGVIADVADVRQYILYAQGMSECGTLGEGGDSIRAQRGGGQPERGVDLGIVITVIARHGKDHCGDPEPVLADLVLDEPCVGVIHGFTIHLAALKAHFTDSVEDFRYVSVAGNNHSDLQMKASF